MIVFDSMASTIDPLAVVDDCQLKRSQQIVDRCQLMIVLSSLFAASIWLISVDCAGDMLANDAKYIIKSNEP